MFTQTHSNYKTVDPSKMKSVVYEHLYNMNIMQLYREQKVITDVWLAICRETAQADLERIIFDGNLRSYYKRILEQAV